MLSTQQFTVHWKQVRSFSNTPVLPNGFTGVSRTAVWFTIQCTLLAAVDQNACEASGTGLRICACGVNMFLKVFCLRRFTAGNDESAGNSAALTMQAGTIHASYYVFAGKTIHTHLNTHTPELRRSSGPASLQHKFSNNERSRDTSKYMLCAP